MAKPSVTPLNSVTATQLVTHLVVGAELGHTTYIVGKPGVGKTDIVRQAAAVCKRTAVTFAASEMLPEDLGGVVAADTAKKMAVRLMPDVVARITRERDEKGLPVLAFFDELNNAAPSVMAACFKLLHEGYAGGSYVPPDTVFVAAGNDAQHSSVAQDLPAPLLNRMSVVNYDGPTFEEWEQYALGQKVHPAVLGFLHKTPNFLHKEANFEDGLPTPTPRSWMAVSDFMHLYDKRATELKLNPVFRMSSIASRVGSHTAIQMEAAIKYLDHLVAWEVIKADPDNAPAPQDIAPAYMQAVAVVAAVGDRNVEEAEIAVRYSRRLPASVMSILVHGLTKRPDSRELIQAFFKYPDILKRATASSAAVNSLKLNAA